MRRVAGPGNVVDGLRSKPEGMDVGVTNLSEGSASSFDPERDQGSSEQATELMARVAHELKTPLAVAKGFAHTLRNCVDDLDPETIRRSCDAVLRGLTAVELLVESLSQSRSLEAGEVHLELTEVEVTQFVAETVRDLEVVTHPHPVSVITSTETVASFDTGKVRQILSNLLSNAAKFSPAHEPIVVEVTPHRNAIEISVTDRGPGIPPDMIGRLFGRYERLGTQVKGTGLGLYISRGLARAHGGDVVVDTDASNGCRFSLRLPQNPRAAE